MLTVIMPLYNEGEFIYRNVETVNALLNQHGITHRFLLVDDGSRDNSWDEISRLSLALPVDGLRLSRNFGKEAALCAALEAVDSDAVVVMDSDLQHPPEMIPKMVR